MKSSVIGKGLARAHVTALSLTHKKEWSVISTVCFATAATISTLNKCILTALLFCYHLLSARQQIWAIQSTKDPLDSLPGLWSSPSHV